MIWTRYEFKSKETAPKGTDNVVTFTQHPGWLARLFGCKKKDVYFVGSATVWWHYPSGKRAGTTWERFIVETVTHERFKRGDY